MSRFEGVIITCDFCKRMERTTKEKEERMLVESEWAFVSLHNPITRMHTTELGLVCKECVGRIVGLRVSR